MSPVTVERMGSQDWGGLVLDEHINTTCLSGDDEIEPSTTTTSTTSITTTTTTTTSTSTATVITTSTSTSTSTSTTTTTIDPELEGKQKGFQILNPKG